MNIMFIKIKRKIGWVIIIYSPKEKKIVKLSLHNEQTLEGRKRVKVCPHARDYEQISILRMANGICDDTKFETAPKVLNIVKNFVEWLDVSENSHK